MKQLLRNVLFLQYFTFDVGAKFSRDLLAKDDYYTLIGKLQSCYPGNDDDCNICGDPRRQESNVFQLTLPKNSTNLSSESWVSSCPKPGMCLSGYEASNPAYNNLPKFIGEQPVAALNSICDCEHNTEYEAAIKGYGPDCTWREPEHDCVYGEINHHNFMTGCECRHPNGTILPYHGWYCEVPNSVLCKENKFYDLTETMTKVGDVAPCKSCQRIIPGCEICEENNWVIKCKKCDDSHFNEAKHCIDECDVDTNSGCNDHQQCKQGPDKAFCECLLPENEDDGHCQPKKCTEYGCNGNGKCVLQPGSKEKTCLCKITHSGLFCDEPRLCSITKTSVLKNQEPCLNGGKCVSSNDSGHPYTCSCKDGFYGEFCEKISPCHPFKAKANCKNHELCKITDDEIGFECISKTEMQKNSMI